jgi:hypothetical protein
MDAGKVDVVIYATLRTVCAVFAARSRSSGLHGPAGPGTQRTGGDHGRWWTSPGWPSGSSCGWGGVWGGRWDGAVSAC